MQALGDSLAELLASMGDDPRFPQDVSRRYGLNKNLSWKVCKIINSDDPGSEVQHVPGNAGVRILLEAFRKHGAKEPSLDAVEEAFAAYNDMIRLHVGDRANLELYVSSTEPGGIHSERLEDKRRLAYQGNSAIWGVQARLGFSLRLVAPNAEDSDRADIGVVGGLHGFRRLRPTTNWPVLQLQTLGEDIEPSGVRPEPMEPHAGVDMPPLMKSFCSTPIPETRAIVEEEMTTYELCAGPVGNTAATDLTFGVLNRHQVPIWGDDPASVGEHYCRVDTPIEHVQFDLLVHRALPFELPPKFISYSRLHDHLRFPLSQNPRFHLPTSSKVREIQEPTLGLVTPLISNYGQLVANVTERMGHAVSDFRAFRVSVAYPPMPTLLVLHHPLGSRPSPT